MGAFGNMIRDARIEKEITLMGVADALRERGVTVTPALISGIERGDRADIHTDLIPFLAPILGIEPDLLRFAAKRDADEWIGYGVYRDMAFIEYRSGKGDCVETYHVLPYDERYAPLAGPFGTMVEANREAEQWRRDAMERES